MESEDQGCEYLDYEGLEDNIETNLSIVELLDSESWKKNFEALDILRKLNKFHRTELLALITDLNLKIRACIESPRSSIAKNALLLISEMFATYSAELTPFAISLGTLLMMKSINEKSFLRAEALKALNNLSNSYYCEQQVIEFFTMNCFHKSVNISQNAFNFLSGMLSKIDPRASLEICLRLNSCNKQIILIGAKNHIQYLSKNWEDFTEAVRGLSESQKKLIDLCLVEKKRRSSLRECIEASKQVKLAESDDRLE